MLSMQYSIDDMTKAVGVLPVTNGGTGQTTIAQNIQVLGSLISANMNTASDQAITINANKYIVDHITVTNASTSLTFAAGGFYTGASKGGVNIVSSVQVFTALTVASKYVDCTLLTILTTDVRTEGTIYLSLTTGQGSAATADVYIIGRKLA